MALYEFYCAKCDIRFERLWRRLGKPRSWQCPKCAGFCPVTLSSFQFKFDMPSLDAQDIMCGEDSKPYGKEVPINE